MTRIRFEGLRSSRTLSARGAPLSWWAHGSTTARPTGTGRGVARGWMVVLRRRGLPWSGERSSLGIGLVLLAGCASTSDAPDASGAPTRVDRSAAAAGQRDPLHLAVGHRRRHADHHRPPDRRRRIDRRRRASCCPDPRMTRASPASSTGSVRPPSRAASRTTGPPTSRSAPAARSRAEVAAPRWCGGEGLTYNLCTLLDEHPHGAHDRARPGPGDRRGTLRGHDPRVVADGRLDDLRARPVRRPVDDARHRLAGPGAAS